MLGIINWLGLTILKTSFMNSLVFTLFLLANISNLSTCYTSLLDSLLSFLTSNRVSKILIRILYWRSQVYLMIKALKVLIEVLTLRLLILEVLILRILLRILMPKGVLVPAIFLLLDMFFYGRYLYQKCVYQRFLY